MRTTGRGRRGSGGRCVAMAAAVAVLPMGLAACGDDDDKDKSTTAKATPLAITTSDAGSKRFKTEAPKSIKGGLVNLTFTNAGKEEHEAQLVRIDGAHTSQDVIELFGKEAAPIPDWVSFPGGAGNTAPGQTVTATLNLRPGKYMTFDGGDPDEGASKSSRGALAEFEVTAGEDGPLPASTATITAATDEAAEEAAEAAEGTDEHAKHAHSFEISGLKAGKNRLRFVNKGKEDHHAVLFPIVPGKTIADVEKFFMQQGRPTGPPPVDFEGGASTAVTGGDTEQVADLVLAKPGKYAVVCFLTDRDGKGKPHFAEGMLEEADVK